jgi:DNA-binding response OmpR family regulator
MNKTILVVDDEPTIREVVRRYLEKEGFHVVEAADGYTAMDALQYDDPDLVVLDLMLPGIDGLTITRQLRQSMKKATPIIMLTAKGETTDRIRGLDYGADDYIAKPFSPRELVSRINAVLRRVVPKTETTPETPLHFGDLIIDPSARTVSLTGKNISLSLKEFDLLYYFARHPRQALSRAQLLANVWGHDDFLDASTVTVHIRRLREKIESDPSKPLYLRTIWGVGYKFEPGDME